jgi:type IV pilus modification protein PilV
MGIIAIGASLTVPNLTSDSTSPLDNVAFRNGKRGKEILFSSRQQEQSVSSKKANGTRGFSLTEVLVATVCLAVGLLAMASLQMTSVRKSSYSYFLTQATYLAYDRHEFLRNLPIGSPQLREGHYNDHGATVLGVLLQGEYTVTEENNLKTIHYAVRWNDGRDHRVTVSTIRSQ